MATTDERVETTTVEVGSIVQRHVFGVGLGVIIRRVYQPGRFVVGDVGAIFTVAERAVMALPPGGPIYRGAAVRLREVVRARWHLAAGVYPRRTSGPAALHEVISSGLAAAVTGCENRQLPGSCTDVEPSPCRLTTSRSERRLDCRCHVENAKVLVPFEAETPSTVMVHSDIGERTSESTDYGGTIAGAVDELTVVVSVSLVV